MKQTIRLLLAALTIVLGLASCATNDLPVDPDVLVKEMSGMWWSLADQEGTYKDATDSYPYTRMGQALCFGWPRGQVSESWYLSHTQAPVPVTRRGLTPLCRSRKV